MNHRFLVARIGGLACLDEMVPKVVFVKSAARSGRVMPALVPSASKAAITVASRGQVQFLLASPGTAPDGCLVAGLRLWFNDVHPCRCIVAGATIPPSAAIPTP